jgi:predicted lactoylglutathione lyase
MMQAGGNSVVPLAVSSLDRTVAFYETLGFRRSARVSDGFGFFRPGACAFAVYQTRRGTPNGFSLAWNCRSAEEVDAAITRACAAGAVIRRPAQDDLWGSYCGFFSDFDGHLWEVAHSPELDRGALSQPV